MNKLNVAWLALGLLVSSCSSFNKMAVGGASGLIYSSGQGVLEESNFEIFKNGMSGNLLLIEGMLYESPKNLDLLATLNKGYTGYAFAVNETQMLADEWAGQKSEEGRKQALLNYTRALNFGLRYLKEKDIEFKDLISKMNEPAGISSLLNKELGDGKRDLEVVLFSAQSLAALINLQKDNMAVIAQLPLAKGMFDWVCAKDPAINFGTCDIFYGAYHAGRPAMLGGNPAQGKEVYLKSIAKYPHNWLIRTSYAEFYLIPQNDEEGFKAQMAAMKNFSDDFNQYYIFDSKPREDVGWAKEEHLRFYQTISLKRYELMQRYQKHFF